MTIAGDRPESPALSDLGHALLGAESAARVAAQLKADAHARGLRNSAKAFAVGGRDALARAASLGPGSARFGGG